MRVGVVGPREAYSFEDNILDCLPDIGVTPIALGPVRPRRPRRLSRLHDVAVMAGPEVVGVLQRSIVRRALDARCDIIVTVTSALSPRIIESLKRAGMPTVLWFPDAMSNLERQLMVIADYDRVYFKD